jgi:hypothetical protein
MIRQKTLLLTFGTAALLLVGSASIAHAQYQSPPPGYGPPAGYGYPPPPPPPPPRGMYRDGLVLGLAGGFGGISASNCGDVCGAAGAFEFHIGGMLNPRTALMGDIWFNAHGIPNSDGTTVHTIYTVAAQYWATDKLWLKGGIGGGNMRITSSTANFDYTSESGLALMGAVGFEVLQVSSFALDLQFRVGHGFYSQGGDVNNFAFMIGANFY